MEQVEFSCPADGRENSAISLGKLSTVLFKVRSTLRQSTFNQKEWTYMYAKVCTHVIIAVLLEIARNWKESTHPSAGEEIMRLIYPGKAMSKFSPLGPGDVTEIIENIYWSLLWLLAQSS